ncbi:MAG: Amuc_1100 family pilus-like protein [Verrucomicrobiota bacterium]|nr:Amuc_1100 family pilus-like protein [Verrucomicrobiota bacterium]
MDWIKENRFYACYAAVMLAGVLALGFWVYKGWSNYGSELEKYNQADRNVTVLASGSLFPNQKNLDEKKVRVASFKDSVDVLHSDVRKSQRDLKRGYTEQQFRNQRNTDTKALSELASESNMSLPENFALGFDPYNKGKAVESHAVSILEWQFDGIKRFVEIAAESGLDSIDEFKRDMIAQESADWKAEGAAPPKGRKPTRRPVRKPPPRNRRGGRVPPGALEGPKNPMVTAAKVMSTYRFTAKVTGSYEAVTETLNKIAAEENYFMWLRRLRIENQKKDKKQLPANLPRTINIPKPGAQPDENGEIAGVDVEVDAEVIFGNEKMKAILVIDLVRFKEPGAVVPSKAGGRSPRPGQGQGRPQPRNPQLAQAWNEVVVLFDGYSAKEQADFLLTFRPAGEKAARENLKGRQLAERLKFIGELEAELRRRKK